MSGKPAGPGGRGAREFQVDVRLDHRKASTKRTSREVQADNRPSDGKAMVMGPTKRPEHMLYVGRLIDGI